jgi:hypothetical protein
VIDEMGAKVSHVMVNELKNDTFYARIVMDVNGQRMEIDARPSDAIALAVRTSAPLFVAEEVMASASIVPESNLEETRIEAENEPMSEEEEEQLAVFRDFIEELDLDDLGKN